MDAERFDDLARTLLTARSRRGVLASVTSGLLATFPLTLGSRKTVAKKGSGNNGNKSKRKKSCPPCKKKKDGKCKATLPEGSGCTDTAGRGGTCQSGTCVVVVLVPAPPPPPPPPVGCPPENPNLCPSGSSFSCKPACPAGQNFDANDCVCHCVFTRACCSCNGGSNPFCSAAYDTALGCLDACEAMNPNNTQRTFKGGRQLGDDAVCDILVAGGCREVCSS